MYLYIYFFLFIFHVNLQFKLSGAKDIPRFKIRALQPFLCNPSFVPGPLQSISAAAAALCAWALQIVRSRPQYMEWLGAVGAAALRAKTPSSPRGRERMRQQKRDDEEDSYGSEEDSYGSVRHFSLFWTNLFLVLIDL